MNSYPETSGVGHLSVFLIILFWLFSAAISVFVIVLVIKALLKYLRTKSVREEKRAAIEDISQVLKEYRTKNKMTQEFVAEAIGVSRQAVSKWENGTSDPSTSNLIALANLYHVSPADLLTKPE